MLLPIPNSLVFDGLPLPDATLVTIDRTAAREAVEWTDAGPHPAFADVPEQRTTITIARSLTSGDLAAPSPSRRGELTFLFSASGGTTDAARKRLRADCVVREVRHDLNPAAPSARQLITLLALSPDGATDPITIESA